MSGERKQWRYLPARRVEMLEAEIERLRAVGDALVDAVERQQWSTVDVAVAAWKEASRG